LWLSQLLDLIPQLRARLRKNDEDIADLNRRMDELTAVLLSNSNIETTIRPGTALDATLLHASVQRAEIERIANLHETTALALAKVQSDIAALRNRIDNIDKKA
jgi:hypothetical protein